MRIGRQDLVQALPDSRLAPLGQSPEAGHSAAEILLLWHEPPTVPALLPEQDATHHLSVVSPFRSQRAAPLRVPGDSGPQNHP
jgi:hypothetical protein